MSSNEMEVLYWWRRNKKRKHMFWIHPLIQDRQYSSYLVAKELSSDEEKFQNFYRMSQLAFHWLMRLVGPHVKKKDTN